MATVERFICDFPGCDKSFDSLMAFRGHQGFHKHVGNYPCEICAAEGVERIFTLPQGLGAHKRKLHGIEAVHVRDHEEHLRLAREQKAASRARLKAQSENGTDPVSQEIREAFAPLVARYTALQSRQQELKLEMEHNTADLRKLWQVLGVVEVGLTLTPPPEQGVQVPIHKVSEILTERGLEWITLRRTAFTVREFALGIDVSNSTAQKLTVQFRDEAKLRLVGKRGRLLTYKSDLGAG